NAVSTKYLLLHRRVRRKRDIVLIAPLRVLSLWRHNTDNTKWQIHHAYVLAHRVRPWKQILSQRLADDDDSRSSTHIRIRKERTTTNRPLAYPGIFLTHTSDGSVPVHVAGDHLRSRVDGRCHH